MTGSRTARTSFTIDSGADAPAVTATTPDKSSGRSWAPLTRRTREQPAAAATFASATVFDELADPITTTASASAQIARNAAWRLVVAKQRSLRFGIQMSGKRSSA